MAKDRFLKELKTQAKFRARKSGYTHREMLDVMMNEVGFENWQDFLSCYQKGWVKLDSLVYNLQVIREMDELTRGA